MMPLCRSHVEIICVIELLIRPKTHHTLYTNLQSLDSQSSSFDIHICSYVSVYINTCDDVFVIFSFIIKIITNYIDFSVYFTINNSKRHMTDTSFYFIIYVFYYYYFYYFYVSSELLLLFINLHVVICWRRFSVGFK